MTKATSTPVAWNDAAPERIQHPVQLHPHGMPTYVEYLRADIAEEALEALRLWRKFDEGDEPSGVELMANYHAAIEATRNVLARATNGGRDDG